MNHSIGNKSTSRFFKLAFSWLTGLSLLTLAWGFSPVTTLLSQAANDILLPTPTGQALARTKSFLPLIIRSSLTFEEQLLNLINAERKAQGLTTLNTAITLMQVAEAHSQDMSQRKFFDHNNPDGLDPSDRLNNAGYKWHSWGEIIGAAYITPEAMFNGWMNSPHHKTILLGPNFTQVGLGYVAGGTYGHYWTAVFAKPQ